MVERLLPQNVEFECGVLGSLLIDPEAIGLVADTLRPEDFYRDAHRQIYAAAVALYQRNEPADFLMICDELERQGQLADIGGASYITSLINHVPTSGNIEYYAAGVVEQSDLRQAVHACGQIVAKVYDGEPAEAVLTDAQQRFFSIAQRLQRGRGFVSTSDVMSGTMTRLEISHKHRGVITGVPTGFTDLNRMTGGLQRSDLIILAARPGVGKTSLALALAQNAALKHERGVAIFSLEMSKEQLGLRMLSSLAQIDQSRLRTGWVEEDEWPRVVWASDKISEARIWIDDTAGISTMDMRTRARQLCSEQEVDLIIVDYLQLMQAATLGKKSENRVQEVSEITRSLKALARELNVPIVALAQLSRAVESRQNKTPQLSDLRESGSIEQDADIVLFISRTEPGYASLIVAKHRNGPVGEINLRFEASQTRFADIETEVGGNDA